MHDRGLVWGPGHGDSACYTILARRRLDVKADLAPACGGARGQLLQPPTFTPPAASPSPSPLSR